MPSHPERPLPSQQLDLEALELAAEYAGCLDTTERQTMRAELRQLEQQRRMDEAQAEILATLPDIWQAIYGGGEGLLSLFAGRRTGTHLTRPRQAYFPYPDQLDEAVLWVQQAGRAGSEVYHCAHLTVAPRRRKATAAPLWALYVDLDDGQLEHPTVPPPSMVVASSPQRFQAYWQLTRPVAPATGEQLNRRLAAALGADPSGWDLTQLLRVPGTCNFKYDGAPLVQVVAYHGQRLDPDTLAAMLPSESPATEDMTAGLVSPHAIADGWVLLEQLPLTAAAQRVLEGRAPTRRADGAVDRSATLVHMARVLYGAGVAPEQIGLVLAERDVTLGWRKYTDREDARQQYARIAQLVTVRAGRRNIP